MPTSGFRLWLVVLVVATAVTVLLGYGLRLHWPPATADPAAQAAGFVTALLLAWPWFKRRSQDRLKLPVFAAFVVSIAILLAVLRIEFIR
jgi:hypothetical protein